MNEILFFGGVGISLFVIGVLLYAIDWNSKHHDVIEHEITPKRRQSDRESEDE